jgi:energy-coupling factor transporter ATP-binding protein EcfA2
VRSNLFGVVYVLDEPSAGLHPADTEALLRALDRLKAAGNSLFVVEHEVDVIRHADWIVDVGPDAGQHGGEVLYSGPPAGLAAVARSRTARHLFGADTEPPRAPRCDGMAAPAGRDPQQPPRPRRRPSARGVYERHRGVRLGQVHPHQSSACRTRLRRPRPPPPEEDEDEDEANPLEHTPVATLGGHLAGGLGPIQRLIRVDQRPIGRTPRSNLATYTGLFDPVRKRFAETDDARARRFDAGRFSFNVAKGRCAHCEGEGFVVVELLFLPSVYAPCPTCHGTRYNADTLAVRLRGRTIAEVLAMTVDDARDFFADDPLVRRPLDVLHEVGLGYLRLGQPATELSGGEAQRIKLATELQRASRGRSLYVLDEPTTGLHPDDVERLMKQLDGLVAAGNTVVVVEHDMRVVAGSDWVIDMGPGAGDDGGRVVVAGSRHGWVNTVLGWSFDLLGGSSYAWQRAHNVVHHTFTNVPGVDRDIDGAPFMMFYAHERVPRYYRWQHVFAFLYYPLTMLAWTFVKDFVELARGDVGATHWRGWAGMLLGKVAHVGVYLVVPLLVYPGPWWVVVLGYLVMQLSLGLSLAVVFQLAHVVEGTTFPRADGQGVVPGSWAEHQLYTTSNFAMESRWVTALTGGLNHQIEHHLFPKVSHTHYRALGPIVRRVAAEYGLPYHSNATFSSALASHVRTLRRFGAAPVVATVPVAPAS